jgi:hypothetical protein
VNYRTVYNRVIQFRFVGSDATNRLSATSELLITMRRLNFCAPHRIMHFGAYGLISGTFEFIGIK